MSVVRNPGEAKIWTNTEGRIMVAVKSESGAWAHLEMSPGEATKLAWGLLREIAGGGGRGGCGA